MNSLALYRLEMQAWRDCLDSDESHDQAAWDYYSFLHDAYISACLEEESRF